jgi:hypothetical protein
MRCRELISSACIDMMLYIVIGVPVFYGKKRVMLSHPRVCEQECTNVKCAHQSHSSRKCIRKLTLQQEKAKLMAGFKPNDEVEFKQILKKKLQGAGMDRYHQHMISYDMI